MPADRLREDRLRVVALAAEVLVDPVAAEADLAAADRVEVAVVRVEVAPVAVWAAWEALAEAEAAEGGAACRIPATNSPSTSARRP